jgi:hypothetical protein
VKLVRLALKALKALKVILGLKVILALKVILGHREIQAQQVKMAGASLLSLRLLAQVRQVQQILIRLLILTETLKHTML